MLVLSQYHIFESYKTNIYRALGFAPTPQPADLGFIKPTNACHTERKKTMREGSKVAIAVFANGKSQFERQATKHGFLYYSFSMINPFGSNRLTSHWISTGHFIFISLGLQ
jgi:hypothetical protein